VAEIQSKEDVAILMKMLEQKDMMIIKNKNWILESVMD
jgi:hypothetical protein